MGIELNIHQSDGREIEVKTSSNRSFGLVFTVFFSAIALWPLTHSDGVPRWWALSLSGIFALASLIKPSILAPLNRGWTKFGLLISKVVNPIVMGVIYFGVVTPTGLILRLCSKDSMSRSLYPSAKSYWKERQTPGNVPTSMNRQF